MKHDAALLSRIVPKYRRSTVEAIIGDTIDLSEYPLIQYGI